MSQTLIEDLIANAVLGAAVVAFICLRDFCKRIAHSDCAFDSENGGLQIRLPTWHPDEPEPEEPEPV